MLITEHPKGVELVDHWLNDSQTVHVRILVIFVCVVDILGEAKRGKAVDEEVIQRHLRFARYVLVSYPDFPYRKGSLAFNVYGRFLVFLPCWFRMESPIRFEHAVAFLRPRVNVKHVFYVLMQPLISLAISSAYASFTKYKKPAVKIMPDSIPFL